VAHEVRDRRFAQFDHLINEPLVPGRFAIYRVTTRLNEEVRLYWELTAVRLKVE
jgi:hypothetical protein